MIHMPIADQLEIDFGIDILSDLVNELLTRNGQRVRLFDETEHTAEYYYRADPQGKPYIHDYALSKRYYPISAYGQAYNLDFHTALGELCQKYRIESPYTEVGWPRNSPTRSRKNQPIIRSKEPIDYLSMYVYQKSQSHFERNGFYQYLCRLFDKERASSLFAQYRLGTSRQWTYENTLATCFPQIDRSGNLRQVKVIPFHPRTGRRAKDHDDARRFSTRTGQYEIDTAGKVWFAGKSLAGDSSANLKQCFFGEHLLKQDPDKPVALVEGESTAIVCSAYWDKYIWLATGGSTGCRWYEPDMMDVCKGRDVILWPDTGKYDDWSSRSTPLQRQGYRIQVSCYVQHNAPNGATNLDLRDLLTGPRWFRDNKLIFGEVLEVGLCDTYPPSWD